MRVRLLRSRVLNDAGVERPLTVGQVYDLPAVVAETLLAAGAAEAMDAAVLAPPEIKPMAPPERKASRRTGSR